jgi:hypothetical protein
VLATEEDGFRIVLKLTGWNTGSGVEAQTPALYLGPDGWVKDINAATDIRGPRGWPGGGGGSSSSGGGSPGGAGATGAQGATGATGPAGATGPLTLGQALALFD